MHGDPVNYYDPTGLSQAGVLNPPRQGIKPGGTEYALLLTAIALAVAPVVAELGRTVQCLFIYVATFIMGANGLPTSQLPFDVKCQFPVCEFSFTRMPHIVTHMVTSQFLGKLRLLTLDENRANANARRAAACGQFVRTPGIECEEYPFATTIEGGSNALTAGVPWREQSRQGRTITACKSRFKLTTGSKFFAVAAP